MFNLDLFSDDITHSRVTHTTYLVPTTRPIATHEVLPKLCITTQLYSIFEEYAKTSPHLGMTSTEFRNFLVHECGVSVNIS